MSPDSLRRLTEGWGAALAQQREGEAAGASGAAVVGESPRTRRVAEVAPITTQAMLAARSELHSQRFEQDWQAQSHQHFCVILTTPECLTPTKVDLIMVTA